MTTGLSAPRGFLRLRVSQLETHYLGGMLSGAALARMMTDCGSEMGIRNDGTDGYLAAYEEFDLLAPVYAGDFVEINAELTAQGTRSRRTTIEARRVIRATGGADDPLRAELLPTPEPLARGVVVAVVPRDLTGLAASPTTRAPATHPGGLAGFLRVRVNNLETHYLGGLLAGASLTRMMADCASEIGIRRDGRATNITRFEKVDVLAPVYAGDFLEITATVADTLAGKTRIAVDANRVLRAIEQPGGLTGGEAPDPPEPVGRALFVETRG